MLMSIMYHHANSDLCSNDLAVLEAHLAHIQANYRTVFPGEPFEGTALCLTFDDAYSDFYWLVYPLLKKYQLKATLAVPTKYILDSTSSTPAERMGWSHNELFAQYERGTFCTWVELREMQQSGWVRMASHSHSHVNLTENGVDLQQELVASQAILERQLQARIDSFVFPFGKYNSAVAQQAKALYPYVFRIGNGIQRDFGGVHGLIYRVNGDGLRHVDGIFRAHKWLQYGFKSCVKWVMG
jgi:peptidoglycan/xylan/chitin deacetylase (PgdA/CDA1 family)